MSDFTAAVKDCKDACVNVEYRCQAVEAKSQIGNETINKLDSQVVNLTNELRNNSNSLEEVINGNKD